MKRIKPSLQMEDEIHLHQKGWIIQRVGWVVILLFLLAAAIGVFGTGWLSKEKLVRNDNSIVFEKFARLESPMRILVHAQPRQGRARISISQSYLEAVGIEKIMPEPASQEIASGNVMYTFESDDESVIQFYVKAERTGSINGQIRINSSGFSISHFVYP